MYEMQYPAGEEVVTDRPLTRRALHQNYRASAATVASALSAPSATSPGNAANSQPQPRTAASPEVPATRAQLRTRNYRSAHTATDLTPVPDTKSAKSASEAPQYRRAHSTHSAMTAPSVASAHTGTYPMLFNIEEHGPLSPESGDITSLDAVHPLNLRELELHEHMWLQEMRHHLRNPGSPLLTVDQLSQMYDKYCTAWHTHSRRNKWDHTYVTNALGVTLGDLLVEQGEESSWMVSQNGESTTFAVRDNRHCATFFPIDAVTRRWLKGHLGWVPTFLLNVHENFGAEKAKTASDDQR
ncbi:DUF3806 domain-containing protein [Jonesia quinghaiensis]|uniref:DUF3806 domain-containing protein n=1 Tax=Jonesia quinghaiensis TaxID=262806 RepID=UPI000408716F|nr:DUF3806 domain-containing protein [Jonesia quinghaiensis]